MGQCHTLAAKTGATHIDADALIRKLGLWPADAEPIMENWRRANAQWRRERLQQLAVHAQRIQKQLARHGLAARQDGLPGGSSLGRRRAVWCVELRRRFATLTEAAAFVDRKASNISQSLTRGVRCGQYHWEPYNAAQHQG